MELIYIDNKGIRATVIKRYLGNRKCFCFSCGNATRALRIKGVNVIGISNYDSLQAKKAISPEEAYRMFECFNATSGCLPTFLMRDIAMGLYNYLKVSHQSMFTDNGIIYVPTGSGETIFALSFLVGIDRLCAVIDDDIPAINFRAGYSPLYGFISKNFKLVGLRGLDKNVDGYFLKTGDEINIQN